MLDVFVNWNGDVTFECVVEKSQKWKIGMFESVSNVLMIFSVVKNIEKSAQDWTKNEKAVKSDSGDLHSVIWPEYSGKMC